MAREPLAGLLQQGALCLLDDFFGQRACRVRLTGFPQSLCQLESNRERQILRGVVEGKVATWGGHGVGQVQRKPGKRQA